MKIEQSTRYDTADESNVPTDHPQVAPDVVGIDHAKAGSLAAETVDGNLQAAQRATAGGGSIEDRTEDVPEHPADAESADMAPATTEPRADSMGDTDIFAETELPAATENGNSSQRMVGQSAVRQVAEINGAQNLAEAPPSESITVHTEDADPEDDETIDSGLGEDHPELTADQVALIERYFDYVPAIAKRTFSSVLHRPPSEEELEDAIGDGNLGLVLAATNLDDAKAGPATTYSRYFNACASGEILHGLRNRAGRERVVEETATGEAKLKDRIAHRKPSVIQGTAFSIDEHTPDSNHEYTGDKPLYKDRPTPVGQGEDMIDEAILRADLNRVLESVPEEDGELFLRIVIGDQKQADIAEELGTNEMKVSRTIARVRKRVTERLTDY